MTHNFNASFDLHRYRFLSEFLQKVFIFTSLFHKLCIFYNFHTQIPLTIHKVVAVTSQIIRDTHIYLNDLAVRNTADVARGKLIAVSS
jgi:hypothetical protein